MYCLLIQIFCGKSANDEINCTHKRVLWVLQKGYESSLSILAKKWQSGYM